MKILTLVLLAAGLILLWGCEETGEDWETPVGDDEVARVVRQVPYGGYFVAGEIYYADSEFEQADLYLVYLNDQGHPEWETTYATGMHNEPLAVQSTADHGFLVLAERSNAYGMQGVFLLKLDESGHAQGMNEIALGSLNRVVKAIGTDDGGFALLGYSGSTDRVTLMKVDGSGAVLFTRTFGNEVVAADLEVTGSGFVLLNNVSRNDDSSTVELIRTDSWGETQWTSTIWSDGWWVGWYVTEDSDGGFMIVGEINSGTPSSFPLIIKTDMRGNWLWRRDYGESAGVTVYAVAAGWNGPLIAGDLSFESGDHDGFALRANSDGDFLWWHSYGGSASDWIQDADATDDGGFILAGSTASYSPGGDTDIYVLKIDGNGGLQWETSASKQKIQAGQSSAKS